MRARGVFTRYPCAVHLLFACVAGCQDLPEIRYETEHLRIGTEFDEPMCAGNLEHLERVVTTIEQQFEVSLDIPTEVYVWDPRRTEPPDWCSADYELGCYRDGTIYGDIGSLDHELVHAVLANVGKPAPFWREGAAEALQSSRTIWGPYAPVANLNLEAPQLRYSTAGHFSRWVLETFGIEQYQRLMQSSNDAGEAFEEIYGMTVEAAQVQFFDEAPYSYGALLACAYPELEQVAPLAWSETIDIDCDQSDAYSSPFGMGTYRILTISERGHYALSTSAEMGAIARCADEDLDLPPIDDDPMWGDVPPVTRSFIFQYTRGFAGDGSTTVYDLAPGRYELSIGFSQFDPRTASLDVHAAPGPVPQLPEVP